MNSKTIFFLQIEPTLPRNYILLASYFKRLKIELVPVTIFNLKDLLTSQKVNVLVLNNTLMTNKNYSFLKRKHLDFMVINRRINLIELSSFEQQNQISSSATKGFYHFLTLPATLKEITSDVNFIINGKKENSKKWPGGRRTRLPELIQGK